MKCDLCDTELEIGMYPFCKGIASNHGRPTLMRSGSGVFPFTVPHVDGKPMVIESMQHLRQVEKNYGVVFSAFSKDNIRDTDPTDRNLPRYRGDDPDFRGRR